MKLLLFILFLFFPVLQSFPKQTYQQQVDSMENRIDSLINCGDHVAIGSIFHDLSNAHQYQGEWEKYDEVVERMFKHAKKYNNKEYEAESHGKVAIASCLIGDNKKAVVHFLASLDIYSELNDSTGISNAYENLGLVYKDMGEYTKALEHQMQALAIRLKIKHNRIPENYSNISQIHDYMGNSSKQYFYLKKAFEADAQLPPKHSRSAILCCEMGEYLMDVEQIDSAMFYFQKGLGHCEQIGWKRGIAVFLGDIAELNSMSGDYDQAILDRKAVLKLSTEINDCMGTIQEMNSITSLYLQLNQLDSARHYNAMSIQKAIACQINYELIKSYLLASEINEKEGDATEALKYYKLYHTINDSVFNLDKQETIAELDTKYQTAQKESQIELLSSENKIKNQRINLSIALIGGLIMAVLLVFYILLLRKKQAAHRQLDLDQKLLRSQMNPHFIFNALGSIQNFMFKNEGQKASFYMGSFSKLMRSVLINSSKDFIPLDEETAMLNNYLTLEQMRTRDAFEFSIDVDEEIEPEAIKIPPMLLQPFVENAVKHGVNDGGIESKIQIYFNINDEKLQVIIEDNGIGINASKKQNAGENHESMALQIFNERKRILEKQLKTTITYSVQDISEISSNTTGTKIVIMLPLVG